MQRYRLVVVVGADVANVDKSRQNWTVSHNRAEELTCFRMLGAVPRDKILGFTAFAYLYR